MSSSKGRHRAPKNRTGALAGVVILGATIALPVISAADANAASVGTWEKVAACESTNNWKINTGNGFFGGLQFTPSTWASYGGLKFASRADLATKAQQINIAEKVLKSQGPGAWPHCGPRAGLSRGGPAPAINTRSETKRTPKKVETSVSNKASIAVEFAKAQVGDDYLYGATGPNSFDCSGLTQAAWKAAGISIPRTSEAQWSGLPKVGLGHLKPGDLIVFYGGASHIGMYIGDGKFVHAPNSHRAVSIDTLAGYYRGVAIGAVRPTPYTSSTTETTDTPKAATEAPRVAESPTKEEPSTPSEEYTVKSGDTLSGIAFSEHIPGGWRTVYRANLVKIGDDPNLIFPNQVLKLRKEKAHAPKVEATEESASVRKTEETKPATKTAHRSAWVAPVSGGTSTPYKAAGGSWSSGRHTGVDFHASTGTVVHAVSSGVVVTSDWGGAYGNEIVIKHTDGTYSQYGHLSSRTVKVGTRVHAGTMIGYSGSTGNATGPHLHFEVRTSPSYGSDIDPVAFLRSHGVNV